MKRCFLCGKNGAADPLERHHIFGGPNRGKSEKYGLVVLLCGEECHRNGPAPLGTAQMDGGAGRYRRGF